MSVPPVKAVGSDMAVAIRLSQLHDALAAGYRARLAAGQGANPGRPENAAQAAAELALLEDLLDGDAPDDASIGLYSEDLDSPQQESANAGAGRLGAPAFDAARADKLLQAAAALKAPGAVSLIEQLLVDGQSEVDLTTFASELGALLHAVETGAPAEAAGAAEYVQASLAVPAPPAGADAALSISARVAASSLAQPLEALVAAAQSGDMTRAGALARLIRAQLEAVAPPAPGCVAPPPAQAWALSLLELETNPLAMAWQLTVLLGMKTTLNKPRRAREDHMAFLRLLGLGETEPHEDASEDE